jgi:hypothetical protein
VPAFAQKAPQQNVSVAPAEQGEANVDAQRGAFDRFLEAHPEIEDEVLSDPPRVADPNYIRDHAALQAFLESHPLVKADPRAFLSTGPSTMLRLRVPQRYFDFDDLLGFLAGMGCLLGLLWVIRAILEHRRWNKSFRVHEEVHTKLIEKFASAQDLNAYLESPAARRLLEWTPPALEVSAHSLPAAAGRIMWAVQAGSVVLFLGLGLLVVRAATPPAEAQPFMVLGTLGVTLGVGFIVSAIASYVLSKHLHLIGAAAPDGTFSNRP